ncbi:MAG: hypothetical protein VKL41_06770 [Snowella sp.]|nr:hypothetical protein [Snowella sp.]
MINFLQKSSCLATTLIVGMLPLVCLPDILRAQTVPSVPSIPTVPSIPSVPQIPKVPSPQNQIPKTPTLPLPGDQIPNAQDSLKNSQLDDITNTPTQLTTWVCNNGDRQIAVETKEISFWNQLTAANKDWKCAQNIPTIPDKKRSFSCEPNDAMGLISVYWLQGKGGKTTMSGWMDSLANKYNMVCTRTETNVYWE